MLDSLREPVRLASGLGADKRLDKEAQQRALACLERFGERLRGLPRAAVRAVGTNSLRVAKNAAEFLRQAESALGFGSLARFARPALVNGLPGLVVLREGGPFAVLSFTLRDGKVAELDILGDPERLATLDLSAVAG